MPANGRPRISRKRGPKRAYSKRLARYPRKAAGKLGSKRLRPISGRRRLRGYATGGLVTKTGPALLHAGEYVTNAATPHPFKTAVVNPFAVAGPRIPDDTSYSTFTIAQTGTNVISPVELPVQTKDTSGTTTNQVAYVCGLRLRPSMADGTTTVSTVGLPYALASDCLNPCVAYSPVSMDTPGSIPAVLKGTKYQWSSCQSQTSSVTNVTTYNWGPTWSMSSGAGLPGTSPVITYIDKTGASNQLRYFPATSDCALSTLTGPMGYALQSGSKCRPVAWGIRIRYGGLTNTTNNINPYGKIFFGIHLPEDEGNAPGQSEYDDMPVYDGQKSSTGVVASSSGPGNEINFAQLESDAVRNHIGCVTMDELRSMPHGLIIGTGPRSSGERLFVDVDYASGLDRCIDVSATGKPSPIQMYNDVFQSTDPRNTMKLYQWAASVTTVPGSQPWFIAKDATNVKLIVDSIIHWEVVPTSVAYTLPGTTKAEPSNTAIMDSASNIMSYVANNPQILAGM